MTPPAPDQQSQCDTFRIANAAALLHLDPESIASETTPTELSHFRNEVSYLRDVCAEYLRELEEALRPVHP